MYSNKYSKSNEFFMIWKMLSIDFKTKKLREGLFFFSCYHGTMHFGMEEKNQWKFAAGETRRSVFIRGMALRVNWCVFTQKIKRPEMLFSPLRCLFFVLFARLSSWFKQLISIDFALIQFLEFIVRLWVTFIFLSKCWLILRVDITST